MNELNCKEVMIINKDYSVVSYLLVCKFKGKKYTRNLKRNKPRNALDSIVNYINSKGHVIDNISYPEINIG